MLEKIEDTKNSFCLMQKQKPKKKNQIDLRCNIWYQFKIFCTGSKNFVLAQKNFVLVQKQIVPKVKLNYNIYM